MPSPWTTDLPVGKTRFLFLDDAHVESARNVRRNFHQLRRLSDQPLIVPDRPTDQINVTIYGTILRDTRDHALHMCTTPSASQKTARSTVSAMRAASTASIGKSRTWDR